MYASWNGYCLLPVKRRLAAGPLMMMHAWRGHSAASFLSLSCCFKIQLTFRNKTMSVSAQGQDDVVTKQEVWDVSCIKKEIWIPLELSWWIVSWIFHQGFAASSCCRSISFCVWYKLLAVNWWSVMEVSVWLTQLCNYITILTLVFCWNWLHFLVVHHCISKNNNNNYTIFFIL